MKCPACQSPDTGVTNSRPAGDGALIRRRRECPACAFRFTTMETEVVSLVTAEDRPAQFGVRRGREMVLVCGALSEADFAIVMGLAKRLGAQQLGEVAA